ncbi:MAG TPA: hypothetical protein VJN95_11550 [Gemmatimonadales bacterium]|nr:hypothetical protein [Gemmatimonadales bacterium]
MKQNLTIGAVMLAAAASCATEIYAPTNDADATLAVTNRSGHAVWYMNVRPCGTSDWGRDVLGTGVVTLGETVERTIPSGCQDVRLRTDPSLFGEVIWTHVDLAQGHTTARSVDAWQDRQ